MGKQPFKGTASQNAKEISDKLNKNSYAQLAALGKEGVRYAQMLVNEPYDGEAAAPGKPPKRRSGQLQSNIRYARRTSSGGRSMHVSIISGVKKKGRPYGLFLETGWKTKRAGGPFIQKHAKGRRGGRTSVDYKRSTIDYDGTKKSFMKRSLWTGTLGKVPPRPYLKPTKDYMMSIAGNYFKKDVAPIMSDFLRTKVTKTTGRFGEPAAKEYGKYGNVFLMPEFRIKIQPYKG